MLVTCFLPFCFWCQFPIYVGIEHCSLCVLIQAVWGDIILQVWGEETIQLKPWWLVGERERI